MGYIQDSGSFRTNKVRYGLRLHGVGLFAGPSSKDSVLFRVPPPSPSFSEAPPRVTVDGQNPALPIIRNIP